MERRFSSAKILSLGAWMDALERLPQTGDRYMFSAECVDTRSRSWSLHSVNTSRLTVFGPSLVLVCVIKKRGWIIRTGTTDWPITLGRDTQTAGSDHDRTLFVKPSALSVYQQQPRVQSEGHPSKARNVWIINYVYVIPGIAQFFGGASKRLQTRKAVKACASRFS